MRLGIAEDVRFVGTANPSSILKLCEMANAHSEELLKDLADGTLSRDLGVPERARAVIARRLRRMPERARRLAAARDRRSGLLLPADYWPNLALIGCWKGGTVGGHVDRFSGWFDPEGTRPVPVRDWGYLSSEARASIGMSDDGRAGVLSVASNFYEFVGAAEVEADPEGRSRWSFRGVEDLELGEEYYAFLTTRGGLYRYDINDVIAVVGVHNRAPSIEFRRKGRGVTSLTGEKVSVTQVIAAFEAASRGEAVAVDHYKAEADANSVRYVFKVETKAGIPAQRRASFLRAIDDELGRLNVEYRSKRESGRLHAPLLHVMRSGWYDGEKKRLVESGQRLFQAKTIILSQRGLPNDPDIEDVVELDCRSL
jgi:hypothetical protein